MKKRFLLSVALLMVALQFSFAQGKSAEYKVIKTIPVDGPGGWDYLTVDSPTHRLFISHGTCVDVIDLKTQFGAVTELVLERRGLVGGAEDDVLDARIGDHPTARVVPVMLSPGGLAVRAI